MEKKHKKIAIVNAHWSNRGDEAAIRPIIDYILKYNKQCEITILFKEKKELQQFSYENKIQYICASFLPHNLYEELIAVWSRGKSQNIKLEGLKQSVKVLAQTDIIIYSPGGAVISDRFWWRKQLEYLLPFICAKIYKIPIFIAAPSIGPFENLLWKNIIRKYLLQVSKKIFVREKFSKEYLEGIGVKKNVTITADMAFYDQPDLKKNSSILKKYSKLMDFLNRYEHVVGITITDFSWHVKYRNDEKIQNNIEKTIKQFIKRLFCEKTGVLLIPQLFGNQNDRNYLYNYIYENVFLMTDEEDAYFQQYIIGKLYAVVGMRYHSNIFAAKMGIPFIAISYEEKMSGFMEMENLQNYLIRLESMSYDGVIEKWDDLKSNYRQYSKYLVYRRDFWRKNAEKTLKEIQELINA